MSASADVSAVYDEQAPFPEDSVAVTSGWVHPSFDAESFLEAEGLMAQADVGLAFLAAPLAGDVAVLLSTDEAVALLDVGTGVTLVGFGTTEPSDTAPEPDQVGHRRCAFSFVNALGEAELQVGSGTASARRCYVDSGGPTLVATGDRAPRGGRRVPVVLVRLRRRGRRHARRSLSRRHRGRARTGVRGRLSDRVRAAGPQARSAVAGRRRGSR